MKQDLPFDLLGAPTSGAPGARILIKAQHVVVFGIENGFDLTPNKWEEFVSELLRPATDASYLFTAYEVGPSPAFDTTGFL